MSLLCFDCAGLICDFQGGRCRGRQIKCWMLEICLVCLRGLGVLIRNLEFSAFPSRLECVCGQGGYLIQSEPHPKAASRSRVSVRSRKRPPPCRAAPLDCECPVASCLEQMLKRCSKCPQCEFSMRVFVRTSYLVR